MNKQQTKFKDTEIGKIPEDWAVKNIGDLCSIRRGASPRPIHDFMSKKGIPWVKIADASAQNTRFIEWTEGFIIEKGAESSVRVKPNDLIVSNSATPGMPKFMKIHACIHDGWLLFDKYQGITKEYMYYLFAHQRSKLVGVADGTVFKNLKIDIVRNHKVGVPPINAQKSIVKILSDLDAKIELNQRMSKTLESIAQIIFKHWFIDFEFLNEDGKPYKSSGGKMKDSELGDIPYGWKKSEIGKQVVIKGGTTPSTKISEYWSGNIAWCTPRDLSKLIAPVLLNTERKITEAGLQTISSGLLPMGTLLLSSRAPIGYLAISEIPVSINQGFIAILCEKQVSNYFMLYWIKNNLTIVKNMSGGSTFQEINKSSFRQIPILVPNSKILNSFNEIVKTIHERIVFNENESNNLSKIRDSLLPKFMSGKIKG